MLLIENQPFPYQKTFLIALIGAIIGQSLILLIAWAKRRIDLNRKRKMIIADLENLNKTLDLVSEKFIELNKLFEYRETDRFTSSIFLNLQLDIYESVPKHELYSIFKKDLLLLVEIYKAIEFLKQNGPYWLYNDYLKKSEDHEKEKVNDPEHEFYCETQLGFIDLAQKNIQNHLKTIRETKMEIQKITSKKNWL